jgi:hypothetical protein
VRRRADRGWPGEDEPEAARGDGRVSRAAAAAAAEALGGGAGEPSGCRSSLEAAGSVARGA